MPEEAFTLMLQGGNHLHPQSLGSTVRGCLWLAVAYSKLGVVGGNACPLLEGTSPHRRSTAKPRVSLHWVLLFYS